MRPSFLHYMFTMWLDELPLYHIFTLNSDSFFLINIFTLIFIHWFSYVLSSASLLYICSLFFDDTDSIFNFKNFKNDKCILCCYIIIFCSIIGIPPFIGFWTKLNLLLIIGAYGSLWIIIISWFLAFLMLLFYLTTMRNTVYDVIKPNNTTIKIITKKQKIFICNLTICLILSGFFLNDIFIFILNTLL